MDAFSHQRSAFSFSGTAALAYGEDFERDMMDLNVNMPIEQALDRCWEILAKHLEPVQAGLKDELIKEFWPPGQKA